MTVVHPAFDFSAAMRPARVAPSARHLRSDLGLVDVHAPLTRADLRALRQRHERRERIRRSPLGLVLVWWFYPLIAGVGLCLVAGVGAAQAPKPAPGSIIVQVPPPGA